MKKLLFGLVLCCLPNPTPAQGPWRGGIRAYALAQVNHYHIDRLYSGELASFLNELRSAMMDGNYNNSDAQTDYFDVGWYIAINLGSWDKPHKTRQLATA